MTQKGDLEQGSPPFTSTPPFFKGQYLVVIYLLQKNIICTYFKSSNEDFRRTRVNNITKLRLCYYRLKFQQDNSQGITFKLNIGVAALILVSTKEAANNYLLY